MTSELHSNNTRGGAGGVVTTSGNNIFSGGLAAAKCKWRLKFEGPVGCNDLVFINITKEDGSHDGAVPGGPFAFYSTHVQLATDIHDAVETISGLAAVVDTSSPQYTYLTIESASGGISNGFTVESSVQMRENFFNINANDEQHLLITLSDKSFRRDAPEYPHGKDLFGYPITGNLGGLIGYGILNLNYIQNLHL